MRKRQREGPSNKGLKRTRPAQATEPRRLTLLDGLALARMTQCRF